MSGLFQRMAERALGRAAVAEPMVAPLFSPATEARLFSTVEPTNPALRTPPSPPVNELHEPKEAAAPVPEQGLTRTDLSIHPTLPIDHMPREAALPAAATARAPSLGHPAAPEIENVRRLSPSHRPATAVTSPYTPAFQPRRGRPASASQVFPQHAPSGESAVEPSIHISIGRIDVRAEIERPAPAPRARPAPPGMSLRDYAKQREEGKR